MKNYLSVILLFLCSVVAFSQGRTSLGIEAGFPTGSGSDGVSTGIGGSLRYEGVATKNLTWLASAGYLYFSAKSVPGLTVSGSLSLIPIEAGVKYYPSETFNGFYFGADIGVVVGTANISATIPGLGTFSTSQSQNKFNFAPGIGYHFSAIDLTARYNVISDGSYFSVRAAIVFGGK
jgi:hypothetical protein